jgi:hypothetical protein
VLERTAKEVAERVGFEPALSPYSIKKLWKPQTILVPDDTP